MSPVHLAPNEAVRAHDILAAKTSIAIHHGTFQLGDEAIDNPKNELIARAQQRSFVVLNNGQFAEIS
jgi:L-ascorbate metabolism protein UlaG (beta-lactamase superfamily)